MNATAIPAPHAAPPAADKAAEKPVTLQLRRMAGVMWWNVATFNAADERACDAAETGVELLCQADPTLHARIVVQGLNSAGVLKSYSLATGWVIGE